MMSRAHQRTCRELSTAALRVLTWLSDSDAGGAHALACDGSDRAPAYELDRAGLATWVGTTWGSSFWQITDAGRDKIAAASKEPTQ